MGYQSVTDLDTDKVIALGGINKETKKANPTKIEGYYLGYRLVDGKRGQSKLHVFQTNAGNVGVWGKTNLDSKLATITKGTMVLATFKGMKPTKNGDMYTYDVKFDPDLTIDVSELEAAAAEGSNEGAGEYTSEAEEGADEAESYEADAAEAEAEEVEEAPVTKVAGKTPAQRKAEVEAMLSKTRKTGTR